MIVNKGKITLRQFMLLFITTSYTPAVRFIAGYTANQAKVAAWLCPFVAFVLYIFLLYIFQKIYSKYQESFMDIIYDITSKVIGRIIVFLYSIWMTLMLALYLRYYAERLVTSIFPNVNISIFVIIMLALVAVIIRSGLVVIARMNEIIVIITTIIFFLLIIIIIPNVDINNLIPISYLDIMPVLKGSLGPLGLMYIPFLLFFSHEVTNKQYFFKEGIMIGLFFLIINALIIISSVGTIGYSIISKSPLSFLIAVKTTTILDALTGFESVLIATWVISDFLLIIIFTYSIMQIFKSLFNLSDYKPLINMYLILMYLLTFYLAYNVFELQFYSADFAIYVNLIFIIILPIIIFIIGKARKKI